MSINLFKPHECTDHLLLAFQEAGGIRVIEPTQPAYLPERLEKNVEYYVKVREEEVGGGECCSWALDKIINFQYRVVPVMIVLIQSLSPCVRQCMNRFSYLVLSKRKWLAAVFFFSCPGG